MRERINRLAKGILDSELPVLETAPTQIEETVRAGGTAKREIIITSVNNLHIKGLIYSSNVRVRLKSGAFGGLHNRVSYEIDTKYLEDGDLVRGAFYLVTNGGEREIPYSFQVECGTSGRTLSGLKTAGDFAGIARKDPETALKLFEYKDFVEAPFMKEPHIRAVYDGLKGRPDRKNGLEEFLVALKVKEPVGISVEPAEKLYENPEEIGEDFIALRARGWGYVRIEAEADGDFIELPVRHVTDSEFTGGEYRLPLKIHPARMHGGRNFGRILLRAGNDSFSVCVEARRYVRAEAKPPGDKEGWLKYLDFRLDYQGGLGEPGPLLDKMLRQLEQIEYIEGKSPLVSLLQAEAHLMAGRADRGCLILDGCRDSVLAQRQDKVELYCFYQYLKLLAAPDEYQASSLVRLLDKYLEEDSGRHGLFLLLLKMDDRMQDNRGLLLTRIKRQFQRGCKSPFLYHAAYLLLNQSPDMLRGVGAFELQVISYAARRRLAGKALACEISRQAGACKYFNRLYYRALVRLYEQYPDREVLEAVCSMLIKGECRQREAFSWYEKGVEAGLSLTRLYEYFLYALPGDYGRLLPKEVLLYFSYDKELDGRSKSVLYANILTYMDPEAELYQEYERDMEKFAMDRLFESRIDGRLAVLYDRMIYKDVIDLPVAKVLPAVIKSYRVHCSDPKMKYAVVRYEELLEENAYLLEEGTAYVPLFSGRSVILFQDAYGSRYASVDYEKSRVMRRPELEKRCFEIYPAHPMLKLEACEEILERGIQSDEEALTLERTLEDLELHPLFQKLLLSRIILFYQRNQEGGGNVRDDSSAGYLLHLDKSALEREERVGICETLIGRNYIKEAFEMIREYGSEGLSGTRLLKLCTKMILQNLFDEDSLLLHLAYQVFVEGKSDSVILDYLCEHYNGATGQMYRLLLRGISEHVETYDLEERLTAQMLFTGCTENVDRVFQLYLSRKKASESIVRAYFTVKSAEYFLEDAATPDQVFTYLEGVVNGSVEKEKLPVIYLLALTKHYSGLKSLEEEQRALCETMTGVLLENGMVFPYFKALAGFIHVPEDILDKGMIQYRGSRDSRVELQIRILPDEEKYHAEDMRRVYQGIFVKQKILFDGESMEYRIYELEEDGRTLKEQGRVAADSSFAGSPQSRYACLNDMGLCLSLKEDEGLKKKMEDYLMKNAAAEELFTLT